MTRPLPAYVPTPGEMLKDELEARGLTQKEFAEILGRPPQAVSEIINAKKSVTPEMALLLAEALGTTPEFWTNLQTQYDLFKARQRRTPDPELPVKMRLHELVPVAELQKRGVLPRTRNTEELKGAVLSFLGIGHLDEPIQMAANFRQNGHWTPDNNAQLAWLKCVEHEARRRAAKLPPYSPEALDAVVRTLVTLTVDRKGVRRIPDLLAQAGILFVLSQKMPRSGVNGAAFWMNGHPVVALSDGYPHLDRFWFNLLHELAHIRLGHEGVLLDEFGSGQDRDSPQEREADAYARDHLIPPDAWAAFMAAGQFQPEHMQAFAARTGRHPSIVSGRFCFERGDQANWRKYSVLNDNLKDELDRLRAC
ncbi:plasmid maintenance system antidote protein, XRE family [Deinococcus aerius]|uniref:Plasmid maintenance system antidote protein, XRE family n=1 Tax=Deinococcus aerius TaxID=200253 RepID=A0A2I9D9H7_9DEIO|nr:HigA family addiction module antitoxin [Deinococcus aerius]GBF07536.1 plasmid maintenance system antidote protein, XRE family [Deinococcus aerius]